MLCKSACAIVKYAPPQDAFKRTTWRKYVECCCIYRNCYQRAEWTKGICHIWSRGRHFSPSLPGDRYLKVGSKSDLRAKISVSIVRYDALAPRPEVLLLWYFVGACAATLKLKFLPPSWRKYPHRVDQIQHAADVIYW